MNEKPKQDHFHVSTKDSISTKLLSYVFSIYLIVAIVLTVFHMVSEYKRVEKNIIEDINVIYLNSNPTMAIALWEADSEQMTSILDGMVKSPIILGVKLSDRSGEYVLKKGETIKTGNEMEFPEKEKPGVLIREKGSELFGYQFPVINTYKTKQHELGTMTLYSSPSVVFSRVKSSYYFIIINAIIKTTILWLVFLWMSRLLLRRPLYTLTTAAKDINMENLENIQIDVNSKGRNELTILADTLNDVVKKLWKSRKELDKSREELEVRVKERTAELTDANARLKIEEEALKQAKQSADAANRSKSLFLANMSHELRTPLNVILGFSQLMFREQGTSGKQQKNLKSIMQSGEHLLELINDVLELSKIEAGKIELYSESFNLHKLLSNLEGMFRLRAQQKGLSLEVSSATDVPKYIRTDRGKLNQLLINLLGNAVKFTDHGGITLDVLLKQQSTDGSNQPHLHLSVSDTGIGISKHEQDRIFDTFFQTEGRQPSDVGTGLGLSISRKFVELMGGSLTVESTEGQGSRFDVDIPVEITDRPDHETHFSKTRVTGLLPGQPTVRLLVAEDNPDNRDLLVTLLRSVGFEVREAVNGREAITIWQQWQPHLIWMDLRMPEVGGMQAISEIRKQPGGNSTKIIALTAHAFEEDRQQVLENGADDFLRKPFTEGDMFQLLEKHLGVQFQYANMSNAALDKPQSEQRNGSGIDLFLQELPDETRDRFEKVLTLGEIDNISNIIAEIGEINSDAGMFLKNLADEFAYDEIAGYLKRHSAGGKI